MLEIKKVEYFVLWECWFDDREECGFRHDSNNRKHYFTSKKEADIYSHLEGGSWGSKGDVSEKHYNNLDALPKYYETARDCALDNLKAKDFIKHFKF